MININYTKMNLLRKGLSRYKMNSTSSGEEAVVGLREHCNDICGSINVGSFLTVPRMANIFKMIPRS
jgi:hypothetical protein